MNSSVLGGKSKRAISDGGDPYILLAVEAKTIIIELDTNTYFIRYENNKTEKEK